jgi:hypothetical protein
MFLFALIASLGLACLYAETAYAHTGSALPAGVIGVVAFAAFVISFLVPPHLFRYTNSDAAPIVMSKVVARSIQASAVVLVLNIVVWVIVGLANIALLEELYVYTLIAIVLFHGFGGAIASHVMYLQATKQYNSNQLAAVLLLTTLILLILVLYFVAFDWGIPRDRYIHVRDLTALTLVLLGYGRAIYLMAHH